MVNSRSIPKTVGADNAPNSARTRSEFGEFMDGFAIRYSAMVRKDLAAFFEHWEYPMSTAAASKIRSLGHEEWLPPGW